MHSGRGGRGKRFRGYEAGKLRERPIDESIDASDDDDPMDLSLLVDEGAWTRAGEELRKLDPQRYIAILKVVEDIVSIHRDPLGAAVASGHFVFSGSDDRDGSGN